MTAPGRLDHLVRMSDQRGLFEHADLTVPRLEHGYCVDDNARLLVVTSRQLDSDGSDDGGNDDGDPAVRLARLALAFVLGAQAADGRSCNRMDQFGRWTDRAGTDDCWGRGLWGLGSAAAQHTDPSIRHQALAGFDRGVHQRSRWPRAMAFATLGAADVLAADPGHRGAQALLADTVDVIGPLPDGPWMWPEPRLRYANATLAEALIAAGAALDRPAVLEQGLTMLAWLLDLEMPDGHLSVVGAAGREPDDSGPQFDQQPIEVAAMADACWRASNATGDHAWTRGVTAAAAWFIGDNDLGLQMFDDVSGGGFDGLHADRVNLNQGAESTLALISTMQRARSFAPVP